MSATKSTADLKRTSTDPTSAPKTSESLQRPEAPRSSSFPSTGIPPPPGDYSTMTTKHAHNGGSNPQGPVVGKPSDPSRVKKEQAIRHKLRTYEAALALKEGYLPSTEQLSAWARYALRPSGVLDSKNRKFSTQGRTFLRDLRAWIEAVVDLGLNKNADDKIQDFLYHTSNASIGVKGTNMQGAAVGSTLKPSNKDVQKAYSKLRLLGNLLYSSPEFRKLLSDFTVLARDVFADAASAAAGVAGRAAESARPSEDISRIEQPAESTLGDPNARMPSARQARDQARDVAKEKGAAYLDQARQKTFQSRDDIESYLREKFPKQRRDAVINRFKKSVADIQKNPDFNDAVDFLIELAQKYVGGIKDKVVKEASGSKPSVETDQNFDRAIEDLKAILMVFADGKSLDDINDAASRVINDIQNDEDLKAFYSEVVGFFKRALTDKGFITTDAADAEAHRLYDRSQDLLSEKEDKYMPDIDKLFDEVRSFRDAIVNDRENSRVVEASMKVFSDLVTLDKNGNFKGFKKQVVKDIFDVVLPRLITEVKYIPIPRIEYQDRDYDLILENVILESEHFIPYKTFFEAVTRAEFVNDYVFTSKYSATTRVQLQNINLFAKDISFIIRKKTGIIPFNDRGFFDVFMDGKGASAELILDAATDSDDDDNDVDSYFRVRSVKVQIHRFKYNYNASHSWAAALLSPIIRPVVRSLLSRLLEQKIRETFEKADKELHAMAERMRVATIANAGGGSLEAWITAVLSRPQNARRGGGSGRGRDFQVNVGMSEELFPGEHGPGGVLLKVKESADRVHGLGEERGWKNEIFDVKA